MTIKKNGRVPYTGEEKGEMFSKLPMWDKIKKKKELGFNFNKAKKAPPKIRYIFTKV